jgi:hypothetical protein
MPDPLSVAYARADVAAAQWEFEEAVREEQSAAEEYDRVLMSRFPHKAKPEKMAPRFCRCGWRLDHNIHQTG